jgi:hypothetical protein
LYRASSRAKPRGFASSLTFAVQAQYHSCIITLSACKGKWLGMPVATVVPISLGGCSK